MKFNTTYTPRVTLAQTIIFYEKVHHALRTFLQHKLNLTPIIAPAFFPTESALQTRLPQETRPIDFDMAQDYNVGELPLGHGHYLRHLVVNHQVKPGNGYFVEAAYIWRDAAETPTNAIARHEITGQIVVRPGVTSARQITSVLYQVILELAHEAQLEHKIPLVYPPSLPVFSAQNLEYEWGDASPLERERAQVEQTGAFALAQPGRPLVTGHVHREIDKTLYDERDGIDLFLLDRVNTHPLRVATITQIATGAQLLAQLGDRPDLKVAPSTQALSRFTAQLYEIKVNLPLLTMAVLAKGHLAEVQPDIYSNEKKVVKSRYKIDTY